jgi:hypothetical protein
MVKVPYACMEKSWGHKFNIEQIKNKGTIFLQKAQIKSYLIICVIKMLYHSLSLSLEIIVAKIFYIWNKKGEILQKNGISHLK